MRQACAVMLCILMLSPWTAAAARPLAAQAALPGDAVPVTTSPPPDAPDGYPLPAAGEFVWLPQLAPAGPVLIVVSLPQQLLHVYRNGIRIGLSSVSTGRDSHRTPTGVYSILQKRREHYSNLYDDAPMPWMQRLTWDGIALHGGHVTGQPASHGCIRLPEAFARALFELTTTGMLVVVTADSLPDGQPWQPGLRIPLRASDAMPREALGDDGAHWSPQRASAGPISLIISSADARLIIMRADVEIGSLPVRLPAATRFGLQAWQMLDGHAEGDSPLVAGQPAHRWQALSLPATSPGQRPDRAMAAELGIPSDIAAEIHAMLEPGATLILTDESVSLGTDAAILSAELDR